ncbi:unnamed protein product [Caenorhabditis bovis]|uniref:Carbonic anhydrase n=1 Tax=Caenorhabditis bovis TaxID=2654633 RepID=A0A8S1EKI6_9PELO|nr:unnamed protein product [Caenorhabditis bovis]
MYRSMVATIKNSRQSPIDIQTRDAIVDVNKCKPEELVFEYVEGGCDVLEVGASTCKIHAKEDATAYLTASHLPGKFKLLQFHFHWGEDSSVGSEHLIDGQAYSGEVHFVFWNMNYESPDNAVNHKDGLAVLGVFIKEGEYSDAYSNITSLIRRSLESGGKSQVSPYLDLRLLIPRTNYYYAYDGSLTTPPYSENVLWTVMMDPVQMSAKQLNCFRLICPANYRKCQYVAGRKICCTARAH